MWWSLLFGRRRSVSRHSRRERVRSGSACRPLAKGRLTLESLEGREAPSALWGDPLGNALFGPDLGSNEPYGAAEKRDTNFAPGDGRQDTSGGARVAGTGVSVGYGGEAAILWTALGASEVRVVDTGSLPPEGGLIERTLVSFDTSLSPIGSVSGTAAYSATAGADAFEWSWSFVTDFRLTVGVNTITADRVEAWTALECRPGVGHVFAGESNIVNLRVNGVSVAVTGEPNQRVPLILGELIVNQQISGPGPGDFEAGIIVASLHATVLGVADVWAVYAYSGMYCQT